MQIEWTTEIATATKNPIHTAKASALLFIVQPSGDKFIAHLSVPGIVTRPVPGEFATAAEAYEACRLAAIDYVTELGAALALATHTKAPVKYAPVERNALKALVRVAIEKGYALRWAGHRLVGRDESRMPSDRYLEELAEEVRLDMAEEESDDPRVAAQRRAMDGDSSAYLYEER